MVVRVDVEPRLLTWAQERSRLDRADLVRRFPKLELWEQRQAKPTLKQLDNFAQATHTPVGILFLPEPPQESVPIRDYRTIADRGVGRPSADLLDTIFQCQQRQEWYHDYARVNGEPPVPLVGSVTTAMSPIEAAAALRTALRFDPSARGSSWSEALHILAEHAEDLGANDYDDSKPLTDELERLAKRFRVSTLVVLRRVHDAGHLTDDAYRRAYRDELRRVLDLMAERGSGGGNFYTTQPVRISKRFARALVASTLEGQTLHRDAFRMLGFKKLSTCEELAGRLGEDMRTKALDEVGRAPSTADAIVVPIATR